MGYYPLAEKSDRNVALFIFTVNNRAMNRIIEHNGKKYIHIRTKLAIFRPGKNKVEVPIVIQSDISHLSQEDMLTAYKTISGIFDKPYIASSDKLEKNIPWYKRIFGSK